MIEAQLKKLQLELLLLFCHLLICLFSHALLHLRRSPRPGHERPGMEPRPHADGRGHPPARSGPAMREGNIGLCMATQIARYIKTSKPLPGWHSPQQAWAMTQAQLARYKSMEDLGQMRAITDLAGLEAHLVDWQNPAPDAPPNL